VACVHRQHLRRRELHVDHLANEPEAEPETRSLLGGGGPLELLEDAGLIVVVDPDSLVPGP
jgi:hypothetical protein